MTVEEKNMELMKTLDDAWNSHDWDTFEERQSQQEVCITIVRNQFNSIEDP